MKALSWLVAGLVLNGLVGATAYGDHLRQAHKMADQLACQANDLHRAIQSDFRGVPQYGRLVGQSNQLRNGAARVVDGIRAQRWNGLHQDLSRLERLACQIDELVEDVDDIDFGSRHCRFPRVNTRVAHRLVHQLRDLIDDLADEIDDLCRTGFDNGRGPRYDFPDGYSRGYREDIDNAYFGQSRPTVYFGNGRFGLQWIP